MVAVDKMYNDIQSELDRLGSSDVVVVNEAIERSMLAEPVELRDRHGNVRRRFRLLDDAFNFLQKQECRKFGDSHLPEPTEYGHFGSTCSECGRDYLFCDESGMYVHP